MGEGGGSIVRISSALAAATDSPLELVNIRANRPKPGLQTQHLEALNALKQFSGIHLCGAELGSSTVSISPTGKRGNIANIKIGTAGNISLVAQAIQYYSLFSKTDLRLNIDGGATHGKWAPSIEFIQNVTFKLYQKFGKKIVPQIEKYGFYPKGGAQSSFLFYKHDKISSFDLIERGNLEEIHVFSTVSSHLKARKVAERQIESFITKVKPTVKVVYHINYVDSMSPGASLTIINQYSSGLPKGCFVLGEKSLTAENVGKICWKCWKNIDESLAAIDPYTADQLIVPMSLCDEDSSITTDQITSHTKTNINLVQMFTPKIFEISKKNGYYLITAKHT